MSAYLDHAATTPMRPEAVEAMLPFLTERFGNPSSPGSEPGFFAAWGRAAGWNGGQIEQSGTPLTSANWNSPWPEQPVSAYALSNLMEDFSESLPCYVDRPQVLAARSPARYRFIDSRVAGWRGWLRTPVKRTAPPGDYPLPARDGGRYA